MYPTKKLGEIAKTTSGGTPLRSTSIFWGGNIPWLKSGELNDNLTINSSEEFITEEGLNNSSAKVFKKGTLLIALYGATAGKLGILDFDSTTNQAICSIQNLYGLFEEKYIFYFLFTKRKQIIKDSFGGAQPNISKGYLDNLEIPLSPLPTQKLIVQKLDSSFEKIDKSIELTKKNLENIEELNKSVLENIFSEGDYKIKKMSDVCHKITDGTHQTPTYFDNGIIFLSSKNVTSGFIDWENIKYIDKEQHIQMSKRVSPQKGDILLAKNGTTGVGAIVDKDEIFDIYVSLALLRPKEIVLSKFLLYFINSPIAKRQFNSRLKGVGVPNLHLKEIKEVEIPLPPLEKQKEIVAQLDIVFEKNKALKESYEKKLKDLEEMKQSLLKEAFEGRLVKE